MSLSLLVLGALNDSAAMADSVSLSLNPLTPSEPSALGLGVFGSLPSAGGLETEVLGVGASAASLDRLETGVCWPVGTVTFSFSFSFPFVAIVVFLLWGVARLIQIFEMVFRVNLHRIKTEIGLAFRIGSPTC